MSGLYLGLIFVLLFTTIALFSLLQQKILKNLIFVKVVIVILYFLINIWYFSKFFNYVSEYKAFNNETITNIKKIVVDNNNVNKDDFENLFTALKTDTFSWVNHPSIRKTYNISVFTTQREYKFIVWDTYNQGILVKRVDYKGNDYVTNRNDILKMSLEKNIEIPSE